MNGDKETLFIPLELENTLSFIQRCVFAFSCLLHLPALYCLIKETPPHQAQIKPILLVFQFVIIIGDVLETIPLEPVVLPEALAGYCRGLLCKFVHALFLLGINALGMCMFICILTRHQTVMPASSGFRMRKSSIFCVISIVFIFLFGPVAVFIANPLSDVQMEGFLNESRYDIAWIRERGPYLAFADSSFVRTLIWVTLACLLGAVILQTMPFWHMLYVLEGETSKSAQSKLMIRQSLLRLFVQLNVPFLFVTAPLCIVCLQAALRCFPLMVAVLAMFSLSLHAIVHNLVLLLQTPAYRTKIMAKLVKSVDREQKNTT